MNNEERIITYLVGEMEPIQKTAFETELQTSGELAKELEEYKSLFSVIADVESAKLPERSGHRFNEMLDAEINKVQSNKTKVVSMRPKYFKMIGIAASFALLGLFIGYQMQNKGIDHSIASKLSDDQKNEFIQLVSEERTSKKIHGLGLLEGVTSLDIDVITTLKDVLFNDPSTNVRLAVIDALKVHIDQEEIKEILITGLKTIEKPMIKIGLIQALSNTRSKQYIPELEHELENDDLDNAVRDELHVGIMKLLKNT